MLQIRLKTPLRRPAVVHRNISSEISVIYVSIICVLKSLSLETLWSPYFINYWEIFLLY